MSGDVQPRKRKDKKRKKDELGVEEPRGTAAVFGEGDVFMHSYHEHGTGGHWCAKIIFFSLLAVLVTLIGLIILENRGLTELEANAVESRYSGVLEGWLEDAPDDDHHDEHTLDLKHHDDDEDDEIHGCDLEHDEDHDDFDHSPEEEQGIEDEHSPEDDDHEDDDDDNLEDDDDNIEGDEDSDNVEGDDDDDNTEGDDDETVDESLQDDDDEDSRQVNDDDEDDTQDEDQNIETADDDEDNYKDSEENNEDDLHEVDENDLDDDEQDSNNDDDENKDDDDDSNENEQNNEDEEEHEEVDSDVEVEHIEREVTDDDVQSAEEPLSIAKDDDDSQEISKEANNVNVDEDEDVEFLEPDDLDELPEVLPIPVPTGKPLAEFEETSTTERPHDTLAEEEEYERQQEELRKEKEQASHGLWLKLTVGGALLVATHAVLRRAAAPQQSEDSDRSREETPLADRRMTLIPETPTIPTPVTPKIIEEVPRSNVEQKVLPKTLPVVSEPPPAPKEEVEEEEEIEEEEEEIIEPEVHRPVQTKNTVDMELYSDEEEEVEEEEIEEKKEVPKQVVPVIEKEPSPEPELEEDDDVEIIDDEQIEEELEDEEDDISDVDDAELLSRLEAKYGRLPEPERPGRKDGGNSIEAEWPGEPSDPYWQDQLDQAQRELREGEWSEAARRASVPALSGSARARYVVAKALDSLAEAKRDNGLLTKAIAAYLELLKMNEKLSDKKLIEIADRTLDRIKFRGNYLGAEPIYRLLIRRFPDEPHYRNNLTVSFLMANRADLAEKVLLETLKLWPDDRVALAHLGFVLKTKDNKLEEAVEALTKALAGDAGPACTPRFYYHLGDALLLLGRRDAARQVHERAAAHGHFLSPAQRSLYNVDRLRGQPWWDLRETPYLELAKSLENSWREILQEGEAAEKLYEEEKEGLRERGEWSQLDLFVRGREVAGRCARAPVTCRLVRAAPCRRGQVKFSAMRPGTHVRPHVGPTNCRLRMHLGLKNTKNTFIRVDQEIRQWEVGKVFMFDDSFEHEVWHNGTGTRLVLIVDVWHPDLTPDERRQLPAI